MDGGKNKLEHWDKQIYTTIYKMLNNKVLLHSTWDYFQHLIITYSGKESEKLYVCIYLSIYLYTHKTESHFWTPKTHNIVNRLYLNKKKKN